MRFAACMGITLEIIHPCGFIWDDARLRRAGMDYQELAAIRHHKSYQAFCEYFFKDVPKDISKDISAEKHRLILLDTRGAAPYTHFSFQSGDILMAGRESCGVPEEIFESTPHKVYIPMVKGCRSLNVAIAASMVVGEGLRQLKSF